MRKGIKRKRKGLKEIEEQNEGDLIMGQWGNKNGTKKIADWDKGDRGINKGCTRDIEKSKNIEEYKEGY